MFHVLRQAEQEDAVEEFTFCGKRKAHVTLSESFPITLKEGIYGRCIVIRFVQKRKIYENEKGN